MKKVIALLLCIIMTIPQTSVFADTPLPSDVVVIPDSGSTPDLPSPSGVGLAAPLGADAKVAAGDYYLYPRLSSSRVITIKDGSKLARANAYLYKYAGRSKQIFNIRAVGDGTYIVRNQRSGLVLEAAGGKKSDKTNVQQNTYTGAVYQRWYIFKKGAYYIFQNAYSRKVLHIQGGKNVAKANLCIYKYAATSAQKFTLKKAASPSVPQTERTYMTSTRLWNDSRDYDILTNIIGAVESGGQVYGNRDYAAYEGAYANSANEVTITLGWAQFYGVEGQKLIQNIYNANPAAFKAIDTKGKILKALQKDWVATHWTPTAAQKKILIKLITSDIGKKCQDNLFKSYMVQFVNDCKSLYTSNAWAIHMYCQIRHLGGPNGAKRIFDRCAGDYSLDNIMAQLKKDQSDPVSSYQVGDTVFWSRHVKCCEFLQKYAV